MAGGALIRDETGGGAEKLDANVIYNLALALPTYIGR